MNLLRKQTLLFCVLLSFFIIQSINAITPEEASTLSTQQLDELSSRFTGELEELYPEFVGTGSRRRDAILARQWYKTRIDLKVVQDELAKRNDQ